MSDNQETVPASAAESAPIPSSESAAAMPDASPAESEAGIVADLEKLLAETQSKVAEHHDAFLRAKAETENIRRRAAEDVQKAHKFGVERMAEALVAVKDSLDAALSVENATVEAYKTGVELTGKQLTAVFEKFSIVEVNPVGEKFDPNKHQAIASVESPQEPNTVVTVMQKGFVLHDRVLRPALVTVSKGPAA
ncbi:MAG: nucleotide exchange factor GrpE [Betaproteobacteria bacterium]|nr:nucleotide exchange factor GrpE [Betaproteobacteria bacterium]